MNDIDSGVTVAKVIFTDKDAENGTVKFCKRAVILVAFHVVKLQFAENGVFLFGLAFLFDGVAFTAE